MLKEFVKVAQEKGSKGTRRWFSDEELDLVVWLGADGKATGFMLSYGKSRLEKAFEWREGKLRHYDVDDGEGTPLRNDSPVLVPSRKPGDPAKVLADFLKRAGPLDAELVAVVTKALTPTPI